MFTIDSIIRNLTLDALLIDRGALARLFLNEGANVNAWYKIWLCTSGGLHGRALELASDQNHKGVVKMLQEATCDPLPNASPLDSYGLRLITSTR